MPEKLWPMMNLAKTAQGEGVCAAMTMQWIRQSIKLGRDLAGPQELGKLHLIAIKQGAHEIGHTKEIDEFIDAYALRVTDNSYGEMSAASILQEASTMNGYIYISMRPQNPKQHGHAIGFRHEGSELRIFDPNEGLIKCTGTQEFTTEATRVIDSYNFAGGRFAMYELDA